MQTITKLREKFGGADLDHLIEAFGDIEIPVITDQPQRQGDLSWWPMRMGKVEGLEPVGTKGIAVIRGEAGGNTHLLLAEGDVEFARAPQTRGDNVTLGTLFVGEGATAIIHHLEHGYQLIGGGVGGSLYVMKGARTQMDEVRRVAD